MRCISFWISDLLPGSQVHRQNLGLCSHRTEGPAFLLSPGCCSAVPSLHVAPFQTLSLHGSFLLQRQQETFFLQAVPSKEFRPVSTKLLSFPSTSGAKRLSFAASKSSRFCPHKVSHLSFPSLLSCQLKEKVLILTISCPLLFFHEHYYIHHRRRAISYLLGLCLQTKGSFVPVWHMTRLFVFFFICY